MVEEEESITQKLQNKVDKLKLLGLTNSFNTINPMNQKEEDAGREIALVNSLSVSKRVQDKFLEIRGLQWSEKEKKFIQVAKAIMNIEGAYRFCQILRMAEEIEWSSYHEEELPTRLVHFYQENIPYILFWYEEYDLNEMDFNYVINNLQVFIDTSFHKAKSGKYINTLGRTFDESTLSKALDTGNGKVPKKEEGFLSKINPFKER